MALSNFNYFAATFKTAERKHGKRGSLVSDPVRHSGMGVPPLKRVNSVGRFEFFDFL
jgi:hypothetical protein